MENILTASTLECHGLSKGWSAHFGRHRNELEGQLVVLGKLAVEIIRVPRVEENASSQQSILIKAEESTYQYIYVQR